MSSILSKTSARGQAKTALERIAELETLLNNFISSTKLSFENNEKNVNELVSVVTAVVRTVGPEPVQEALKTIEAEKAEAEIEQAKKNLADALESKILAEAPVVTADSIVTGREVDAEGTVVGAGYVQTDYANVKPEFQAKVLTAKVGDKVETVPGRFFEITGIFERVAAAPEAPVTE